jgi:hypothetical protein
LHSLRGRRPSAAIVISSVALFLSLGGAGYAAVFLPANSVGSYQLRSNAVTYKKIEPGAVGIVRANTGQLQVRVGQSCSAGSAIGSISQIGKVTCNAALPAEFGTTTNTQPVPETATAPTTISSVALATGSTYLAFANPTVAVTGAGTASAQTVTVSCTLTVGSNTQIRSATITTVDGTAVTDASIPLQLAGGSGTATVACQSSTTATGTVKAAPVSVASAVNALQTASNS